MNYLIRFFNKVKISPNRLTVGYILIALTWMMVSNSMTLPVSQLPHHTLVGLGYVLVSAGLLYLLLHSWQAQLVSTNNLLKAIIDTVPVRIFWKNNELFYTGCNTAFAKDAGGASPDDIIGKNDYDLMWPKEAALYRSDDREIILSGRPKLSYEEPQTTRDGKQIWLSTSKVPLKNKRNEIIGVLGIYDDITERKRIERSLIEEKQTAQNYLDIVGVMILVLDNDKNVKLINRRGCEIIGYKPEEVIGKNWIENFLPERCRNKVDEVGDSLITDDRHKINYFENPILTKEGKERLIAWRNTTLTDQDGNVTGILTSGEDITERRQYEERITYLANFDVLTGLPNRVLLEEHFHNLLSHARRSAAPFAVMFLDLDHFKEINDSLGHNFGDALLVEIAKHLKETIRGEDIIARLGGDEFIILLPDTDSKGAVEVAQKFLETVVKPVLVDQHEFIVTASIGIALYPEDGNTMDLLLQNADAAMYRAKQEGRNGYAFFTKEMQIHATRHMQLSHALHYAIERNELHLVYQPQISLETQKVIGAETLLRWKHPKFGNVSPAEFIPIAEETGLILPIGEWVLQQAIFQAKEWMEREYEPILIAVNLSAVQLRQPMLPERITDLLKEAGLPPEYLEIELTERATMHDPQNAVTMMERLNEAGVRMSIDDFGTGYSNLSYLKKFKIYKLKIDQSFVRDITVDAEDKAIVGAIINMAEGLGLTTIAEGVESAEQLDYLLSQGCREVQGYYFSKPLPPREFEDFVTSRKV